MMTNRVSLAKRSGCAHQWSWICSVTAPFRRLVSATILVAAAFAALADDHALLIQLRQDGGYKVWHSNGATNLSDDELLELAASARPEGGTTLMTTAGPASAVETKQGIVVRVAHAATDKELLLDRDNCGAVRAWHSAGTTQLGDDQLTQIVLTARPDGGPNIAIGEKLAKAYLTDLGVIAMIWKPVRH